MPKYRVTLIRDYPQQAVVTVDAASEDEAMSKAVDAYNEDEIEPEWEVGYHETSGVDAVDAKKVED
jgi:hypothetical protein